MKEGMDIRSISELYTETHTVSHVRTRLQGDPSVNNALNCRLVRKANLNTKKCITKEAEACFSSAIHLNTV